MAAPAPGGEVAVVGDEFAGVPGYARPNIASRLPDFSNGVVENIRAAFMPNNYRSISSLYAPPGGAAAIPAGPHGVDPVHPFKVGFPGKATFSDFTYTCSPYDLTEETRVRERRDDEARVQHIGGDQPFFAGYNNFRMKHEMDGTAFEYVSEPYESPIEARMREKWLLDSQRNPRPFLPPGGEKALTKPTRAMMQDAMTSLHRSICEDWKEAQPTVISTTEDLIVVYFATERVKSESGVLAYMNNALRRNEVVLAFDLRRVPEGWNVRLDEGQLMFTFRPPWVRQRSFVEAGDSSVPPPPPPPAGR